MLIFFRYKSLEVLGVIERERARWWRASGSDALSLSLSLSLCVCVCLFLTIIRSYYLCPSPCVLPSCSRFKASEALKQQCTSA